MSESDASESDHLLQSGSKEEMSQSDSSSVSQERVAIAGVKKQVSKEDGESLIIGKLTVVCILGTELCERLTFYSVVGNMVLFAVNVLDLTSSEAVTLNLIFVGICYMFPAFAGWIADALLGKFTAIFISGVLFVLGLALLPVVALDYEYLFGDEVISLKLKRVLFLIGIILIAFGTGGLKSNVSIFGAEQVHHMGPRSVTSFFNWFYWFVNIGGFLAYSVVVYVQQEISFAIGYLIPFLSMFLAMILFVVPRKSYVYSPPRGVSVLSHYIKLQWHAINKYRLKRKVLKLPSVYDYASFKNGGNYDEIEVEGAKALLRMLPIFLLSVIYGCLFSQTGNTYLLQGIRMNLQLGNLTLPAASLNLFNITVVLLMVPLIDRVLFPCLLKFSFKPSLLQRIGFGFVLCMSSVLCGAGLEILRKRDIHVNGVLEQDVAGVVYNASYLSVLWQTPQYVLMGSSEVFTAITGMEFSYSQSPVPVQGFVMGMYLVTNGAGFLLGSALLNIVNSITAPDQWIPDDINEGYLEYFLFLLAIIMFFDIICFTLYSWNYKYANYGPKAPDPIVQDIIGKLSSSSSLQSRDQSEVGDREPLFPSREARQEALRRSYGSLEAFEGEPIFPPKAHRVEARRRSYGTSASFDQDLLYVPPPPPSTSQSDGERSATLRRNRNSFANLESKFKCVSEEHEED